MRIRSIFSSLVIITSAAAALAAPPDFQREIGPIFAEHCAQCHGVDAAERQSGLRLDVSESALAGGDSGMPAIVPGEPDKSELVRRITSREADERMPPPDFNKPLSEKEIEAIRRWIVAGAKYESHWAFAPPAKASLPEADASHPIDAFVIAWLKERGLALSPPAESWALCRRLYLDLIGLPPSPEQLAAFERQGLEATLDTSPPVTPCC